MYQARLVHDKRDDKQIKMITAALFNKHYHSSVCTGWFETLQQQAKERSNRHHQIKHQVGLEPNI